MAVCSLSQEADSVDRVQTIKQQGSSLHAGPHSASVMRSGKPREHRQQERARAVSDSQRYLFLYTVFQHLHHEKRLKMSWSFAEAFPLYISGSGF